MVWGFIKKQQIMSRFLPHFAVYLVLKNDKGQILMSKRHNTGFMDGFYSLPSGHVDRGEAASSALVRESQEEINITPKDFKLVHTLHINQENIDGRVYISLFFETDKYDGIIKNLEPDKCSDLSWFDFDDLPENTIPNLKIVLENIKLGKIYSELGWG